jgi:hypothetical protein
MKTIPIILSLLIVGLHAQEVVITPTVVNVREPRSTIGPIRSIDVENMLVRATWSPDAQVAARRISGLSPAENDGTPRDLSFALSHVQPLYSPSEEERQMFNQIYSDGLKTLLKGRDFYAETTHANYGPPGTFCVIAILSFDSYQRGEVQKEMVKGGFGVVTSRHSTYMIERFGDDYRDELLRLEGEARANKRGIWKKKDAEQAGTGQPATRPVSKPEGSDKPQPEAEGRSR